MSCQNCRYWHRHYPNDGGVCHNSQREDFKGASMGLGHPDAPKVLGDDMYRIYCRAPLDGQRLVTSWDSTCKNETP